MRIPLPGELWSAKHGFGNPSHGDSHIPAGQPFMIVNNDEHKSVGHILLITISNGNRTMEVYVSLKDIYLVEISCPGHLATN